ncbi:MAG: hypothetical protein RQ735_10980 [Flavobacteriaceae bacterium]|nr:hypothetical protein [Flavobacteriaceae bacterium]
MKKLIVLIGLVLLVPVSTGFASNTKNKTLEGDFFSCDRVVIFMDGDDFFFQYVVPFPDGSSSCGVFVKQI